jgi:hypothetical protein
VAHGRQIRTWGEPPVQGDATGGSHSWVGKLAESAGECVALAPLVTHTGGRRFKPSADPHAAPPERMASVSLLNVRRFGRRSRS